MRVRLTPPSWAVRLQSDLTDWQRAPVAVDAVGPFDIPDDSYFEYAWQDAAGTRRPDPDNTNPRLNPWWDFACHLTGPAYRPDPDVVGPAIRPAGRVLRMKVDSRILGQARHLLVYSPAGHADAALPLVLFQDGKAYFGWGRTPQVLDRLLGRDEVEPAHLVFVPPVERTREYAFNPEFRAFICQELLPAVEARIRCDGRRTAWGASLGGLLSAQLAWQRRDLFQKVVTQSGAYLFSPDMEQGNPFAGNESMRAAVETSAPPGLQWHLDCGTMEWLLGSNERLAAALRAKGERVSLTTRSAGHNWTNWRNGLADGLRFALGTGNA